jgi:aspartate racemase
MIRQTRRLGLVGGMSWHSTSLYYGRLNRAMAAAAGPHRNARGLVATLDYAALLAAAEAGDWPAVRAPIIDAAREMAMAGCGVIALTAVTAHLFHAEVVAAVPGAIVPHVLDAAAAQLAGRRIGLLGTSITCGSGFAAARLGGDVVVLDPDGQAALDHLIQGVLTVDGDPAAARPQLLRAIDALAARGAEAVVLACTELPLLLPLGATPVPVLDAVALHVDQICQLITE